ncbi:MAG: RNA methyltransferase [Lachnospiraceae bacterium]|nr:RNA methyltransferase [Lachnospiraceae bacterium]
MNFEFIESDSNKRIKRIEKLLKSKKKRYEEGVFIAEGKRLVKESLDRGYVEEIYVSNSFYEAEIKEGEASFYFEDISLENVPEENKALNIDKIYVVKDKIYKKISETVNSQGIMSITRMPSCDENELYSLAKDKENAFIVALDGVNDPGNLGTIIRSSLGAGVHMIIMSKDTVDIFNPKVVRATMGAIYDLPFIYVDSLKEVLIKLKDRGVNIYNTLPKADFKYYNVDYTKKSLIVIGNEANGITDEIKSLDVNSVTIPMEGGLESLNAGVAASIMLFEVMRQRNI